VGLLDEEQALLALQMTDDCNDTVHTYRSAVAEAIFKSVPRYHRLLDSLISSVASLLE